MHIENVYILGIESSCDDTAAAVLHNGKVLSNIIANQSIHEAYGGVVPELASRAHQQNIVPVVDQALKTAGISKNQLSAVAFTKGPGLMGSLLVGSSFAKSLAFGLDIPLIEVNHMQAHILAHFIDKEGYEKPEFPFLAMTISGGHTQIVRVDDAFDMTVIGETIDDAVGEAFDKSGKLLGLGYPAGPEIDKRAKLGDPKAYKFTKPKVKGLILVSRGSKQQFYISLETNLKITLNL
jgi:N6-L-threonylcarbamoyladenine synthase